MNDEKDEAREAASRIMSTIDKAADKAVIMCFAMKYVIGIAVYALLKRFVNDMMAEAWMALAFAYVVYSHELVISALVKADIVNKMISENQKDEDDEEKDEDTGQQDIES